MKHGSNQRRARSRGQGRKNPKNQTYESNHPEVKVRGTAQQVFDKYMALARDASSAGDRIAAESYFQFAEHYFRILSAAGMDNRQQARPQQPADAPAETVSGEEGVDSTATVQVDPDGPQPNIPIIETTEEADHDGQKRRSRTPRRSRTQRARDRNATEEKERVDGASIAGALPEAVLPTPADDVVKPEVVTDQGTSETDDAEPLSA